MQLSSLLGSLAQLGAALLILGVLIFVHELGHFLVAKWHRVGVVEFAIGFGKKIIRRRIGETWYSIGIIPLGGYVRMIGDDPSLLIKHQTEPHPDQVQTDQIKKTEETAPTVEDDLLQDLSPEDRKFHADKSRWFLTQRYGAKAAIVIAGPGFNIIFAVLLAILSVFVYGKPVPVEMPIVGDLMVGFPAEKAGLKPLDRIEEIDGKPIKSWEALLETVGQSQGKEMVFKIARPRDLVAAAKPSLFPAIATDSIELKIKPSYETTELDTLTGQQSSKAPKRSRIGVGMFVERQPASFSEALKYGSMHVWMISKVTVLGLKGMIVGDLSTKNIGGPILIIGEAAASARRGLEAVADFMILLSVSLAILNLLPIPVLDGGHLMFFTIEALSGSPVKLKVQQIANQVGMAILLMLMLFAFSNDILRYLNLQ